MGLHENLINEGWEKRHTAFGDRLKESIALFEELGFEVRLEQPELPDDIPDESCSSCVHQFEKTIFIRQKQ
ncbi:MAG: hypothetical protein P9L92_01545 [Candidatus Electryonea clarkiae]|nr:hypothetical protein [Candidatus Electryonea clarkiae]MDP8287604.1 hypothetical protein [Candidatus Electryonea clarkiae]